MPGHHSFISLPEGFCQLIIHQVYYMNLYLLVAI
jgi:hypothetical protein